MENQKELQKHGDQLNQMQTLRKQFSEQIVNLEKASRQDQTKLAGQASRIESLFQGGKSVTQRQDEIDSQLEAVKELVSNVSNAKLPVADTQQSMASFGFLIHIYIPKIDCDCESL
ncbi:hypothetical protein PSTG_18490 [Puccinia striiformis f. sp. tritici PST-78]|uniref:Uncharacterized protein n=1 Tax=Puccinia striiformis f. sp. tritici PST-78 TaxID=1165861 RepID=A0A0L0UMC4_9BASI|nr:hypothetical protein PSTG_18490 [Puccinia striiformis f. sp. tritici PST-78]